MKEPKLLSCFHSFCLNCLEKYVKEKIKNNKFQCPLCNDSIDLPQGGVKNFETNIYIDIEALSKLKHHCDLCGPDVDATNHCVDCNEKYCKRCTETHAKMKVSRTHSLIKVGPSDERTVSKTLYCEKHPKEEVKIICKDCDALLCLVCKLTDHEKHTSTDISDEKKIVIDYIQQNMQNMLENVTNIEELEKRQHDTVKKANQRKQRELEKVKQYRKELEILLAVRMINTEVFIAKTFENVADRMSDSIKTTKTDILSYRNWALQVEKMMKLSDDVTLIRHSCALKNTIETHAKKMGFYLKVIPENSLKKCTLSLTDRFMNQIFSPVFMKESNRVVTKISKCKQMGRYLGECSSLSVFQESCFGSFGCGFYKADQPFSHFVNMGIVTSKKRYSIDKECICV